MVVPFRVVLFVWGRIAWCLTLNLNSKRKKLIWMQRWKSTLYEKPRTKRPVYIFLQVVHVGWLFIQLAKIELRLWWLWLVKWRKRGTPEERPRAYKKICFLFRDTGACARKNFAASATAHRSRPGPSVAGIPPDLILDFEKPRPISDLILVSSVTPASRNFSHLSTTDLLLEVENSVIQFETVNYLSKELSLRPVHDLKISTRILDSLFSSCLPFIKRARYKLLKMQESITKFYSNRSPIPLVRGVGSTMRLLWELSCFFWLAC